MSEKSTEDCFVNITILNWAKHNPRKDVQRPTWFAFDNRMVEDDDFIHFTHGEFKAWIYLLSKASQKQSSEITVNLLAAQRKSSIEVSEFESALRKLEFLQIVAVDVTPTSRPRNVDVPLQTDKQTIQTNIQTKAVAEINSATALPAKKNSRGIVHFKNESELIEAIGNDQLERWGKLFPDPEFLNRELIKAFGYYVNHPFKGQKTLRGWIQALTNWFDRGWPNHVSKLNKKPTMLDDEFWESLGKDTNQ